MLFLLCTPVGQGFLMWVCLGHLLIRFVFFFWLKVETLTMGSLEPRYSNMEVAVASSRFTAVPNICPGESTFLKDIF